MELSYNTQLEKIALTEYGRGVQEMVEHLKLENDRDKTEAQNIVNACKNQ